MSTMIMIEDDKMNILWECSECGALLKDKDEFEVKTKKCPKCGVEITHFESLYNENGEYI